MHARSSPWAPLQLPKQLSRLCVQQRQLRLPRFDDRIKAQDGTYLCTSKAPSVHARSSPWAPQQLPKQPSRLCGLRRHLRLLRLRCCTWSTWLRWRTCTRSMLGRCSRYGAPRLECTVNQTICCGGFGFGMRVFRRGCQYHVIVNIVIDNIINYQYNITM